MSKPARKPFIRPMAEHPELLIKRYAGRRLYNTATSTYLSLDDLTAMVLRGQRFIVRDAETGGDITRAILDSFQ